MGVSKLVSAPGINPDFVALHDAFAPLIVGDYDFVTPASREAAYEAMYAQPLMTASDISSVTGQFWSAGMKPKVAITEHYPLFGAPSTTNGLLEVLDQSQTLAGALFTASQLQNFMQNGVYMANFNLVNSAWFGALIYDGGSQPVPTPFYYVYDLYRNHFGNQVVSASVQNGPTFSIPALGTVQAESNVPTLQVLASTGTGNHYYLAVINRDLHNAQSANISVDGVYAGARAEVRQLASSQPQAIVGTPFTTSVVAVTSASLAPTVTHWTNASGHDVYWFPPNSLTIFKW